MIVLVSTAAHMESVWMESTHLNMIATQDLLVTCVTKVHVYMKFQS